MEGIKLFNSLLFIAILSAFFYSVFSDPICRWSVKSKDQVLKAPEIFWINMDKSTDRRRSLSMHLDQMGWLHRRIKGLSLDDIYIPTDVRSSWDQYDAKVQTSELLLDRNDPKFLTSYGNASHFLIGLVGRGKSNRLKELGCTISHLEAMRQAIYNNRSSSKYAVITEDDIYIPFDIDFQKLAESAPNDFGILQLFNSNEESMLSVWKLYKKDQEKYTWMQNRVGQAASFWSTCAYLINREVLKPVIDKIIFEAKNTYQVRIIAGIRKPCRPKISQCCRHIVGTYSYEFLETPPCFIAPKGFQADSFLYTLNRTYVLTTPLITNGAGGNQSTFHQDHVEHIHQSAFKRQRELINEMISGVVPLPAFVNKSCTSSLPLQMELKTNNTCWYSAPSRRSISIFWLYLARPYVKERLGDYIRNVVGREAKWLPWIEESALYIPQDLLHHWESRQCRIQTSEARLQHRSVSPSVISSLQGIMKEGHQVAFSGLCGRNRLQHHHQGHSSVGKFDLAVTASHLLALYQAKKAPLTETRYAIISSDEIFLAINPNFEALVATAPEKFGFLTFLVDDDNVVDRLWNEYIQQPKEKLWSIVHDKYLDHVSSHFYIVNLDVVGPLLDAVVQLQVPGDNGLSLSILRVIAAGSHQHHKKRGNNKRQKSDSNDAEASSSATAGTTENIVVGGSDVSPAGTGADSNDPLSTGAGGASCYPSECCNTDGTDKRPAYCVLSHGGNHRAESFLWKMAPTYTLHIPIVLRGGYDTSSGYIPPSLSQRFVNDTIEATRDTNTAAGHHRSGHGHMSPRSAGTASTGGHVLGYRQRQILNSIQDGQVPLPEFLISTCSFRF